MRRYPKEFIAYLVLSLLFIYLVDLFTQKPGRIGGNGNLGIIPLSLSLIFIVLFGISIIKQLKRFELTSKKWIMLLAFSLSILILTIVMEFHFFNDLIKELGGPPTVEGSDIYRFGWLNQGTNTLYVNMYTFLAFCSLIVSCYSAQAFLKQKLPLKG
ncbi:hypothetical protein [Bacillus sp. NEB1478]|uniref:hypothetical protein n=1 Tax=Bacillus sp. NEB1478 TaxID=3073816 RepID=UPI002873C8D3|nr:hypothetical protein [Bacillus sp. NEB1478]WNB91045.1 hypothetical protein RGB74_14170 [Bacillus sp. NEB1478]